MDAINDGKMTVLQTFLFRLLSVYYNVKIGLYLLCSVLGFDPSILSVKERKEKPAVLTEGVSDKFVQINGLKLHYVEAGDPYQKPLMLFVHGFPEFWYSWRYQIREFSKDYWCVALDMRGYNESDKPNGVSSYTLDLLVSDLYELIRYLGEKPILVCHDWGSIIGFEFVLRHMDMVQSYVMMCAPPRQIHRKISQTSVEQFRMMWYIFLFQGRFIPELMMRSFDLRIFNALKSKFTSKEDIEAFKYVFSRKGALTPPINYYRANITGDMKSHPMPAEYKRGLLILAENDLYISQLNGPATEKFIPNLKYLLLEDADHFCQQNSPDAVNSLIRGFLCQQ